MYSQIFYEKMVKLWFWETIISLKTSVEIKDDI